MSQPLVLVTESEYRRAERVFASASAHTCVIAPPDEDALAALVTQHAARSVVVGGRPYRDALYRALPQGGVLARFGVGHDGIDKVRATAAGILCTNTPEVLDESVAELAVLLMLAAARRLTAMASDLRAGTWQLREGIELRGKTLVVVGCGRIGQAVARIARDGFGMRLVGVARRAVTDDPRVAAAFDHVTTDFGAAVGAADFVSLHIPAAPENAQFISRERLALFARRAWLINTARGSVVDQAALYDALAEGRLAGAALDVFEREPYVPAEGRDLRTLPNVVLTPHVGSHTVDANRGMAERALHNIALARDRAFGSMDLLNPDVLQAIG